MSIYVIGDLHLSFNEDKPMHIFGENWTNHAEKIKKDWNLKVKENDTVLLLGDFSWSMKLQDTLKDFIYINNLPGKKILLKGNHDYWWTTITNIKKFLEENNIYNIDFLHNNSFEIENKIICGTRGWNVTNQSQDESESNKMIDREANRLKLSIEDGLKKYGVDKEIICCMHYPPITEINILRHESTKFIDIMKDYGVRRCYYGHLHSMSIKDAVQGNINGIDLKLISADGLDFKLHKVN